MQYTVVAYKLDCVVWDMEGFSAPEDNSMVALRNTHSLIRCFPRRAQAFLLENV